MHVLFKGGSRKFRTGGGVAIFFSEAVVWKNELRGGLPKKIVGKNPKQTNKQKLFPVKFVKDFSLIICRFL